MNIDKKLKHNIILVSYLFILVLLLKYIENLGVIFSEIVSLCSPFIFGFTVAFLLKGVLNFYESKALNFDSNGRFSVVVKFKRPLGLVLTYLSVVIVLVTLVALVIPQLVDSASVLIKEVPLQYDKFKVFAITTINSLDLQSDIWMDLWLRVEDTAMRLLNELGKMAYNIIPSIVATTKSIT